MAEMLCDGDLEEFKARVERQPAEKSWTLMMEKTTADVYYVAWRHILPVRAAPACFRPSCPALLPHSSPAGSRSGSLPSAARGRRPEARGAARRRDLLLL